MKPSDLQRLLFILGNVVLVIAIVCEIIFNWPFHIFVPIVLIAFVLEGISLYMKR